MRFDLEEGVQLIWSRGSYFAGGGVHFDREEGIILSLDKGYILISRGLLPPLEEGIFEAMEMELAVAVCVYYNYVGVARFAHAHKNLRVMWHGLCALNLDVAGKLVA